ncbi:LysR family transcriptional regulator [Brachybacterium sp. GPGPB12]|uniref:helix-turn-helix domain-containing protein n=1 Tax=Brachybacterium sp. GPGPB12 TaxID=3023517 RepID=UPI0031342DD5
MTTSTLAPVQDLNLLRTFLTVHRAGSFTAAAPALGLTQPTVTAQIREPRGAAGAPALPAPAARGGAHSFRPGARRADLRAAGRSRRGRGRELRARRAHRPGAPGGAPESLCSHVAPALAPLVAGGVRVHVATGEDEEPLEQAAGGPARPADHRPAAARPGTLGHEARGGGASAGRRPGLGRTRPGARGGRAGLRGARGGPAGLHGRRHARGAPVLAHPLRQASIRRWARR